MATHKPSIQVSSSFRDPSGFVFHRDGAIYRQLNNAYREDYESLIQSGLYEILVKAGLLIPHEEVKLEAAEPDKAYKILKPERISFVSYPYEWSFSELKHAALTTLEIQKKALDFGMSLKDASAYNMQFKDGKPLLIDTLSFEKYHEGRPWIAYRQFCQQFLAPLALMTYKDVRLNQLSRVYIDGVPLPLASRLLPVRTLFKFSLLSHIHLHAKGESHFANGARPTRDREVSRFSLLGLIDNLESAISKMNWRARDSLWSDYYSDNNYSTDGLEQKKRLVNAFLDEIKPKSVWDLGANTGLFSRIAADKGIPTVSFDGDFSCVEKNYLDCVRNRETKLLPLLVDLTNPSPKIGWQNEERMSLLERGPADAVLALALIHHLAISNNLPFDKLAEFFSRICKSLVIEFVPKADSQVQRLLSSRQDIFVDYTQGAFEAEFNKYFTRERSEEISSSERTLYLMKNKQARP